MELSAKYHDDDASPPEKNPGTHWMGALVGPRRDLDVSERKKNLSLPGVETRAAQPVPRRPLYGLIYPSVPDAKVPVLS